MAEIVEKNQKVSLAYYLRNPEGKIIEETPRENPLVYLHGRGNLLAGLEEALEGRSTGDVIRIHIPCEKAYGPWKQELLAEVDPAELAELGPLHQGMEIERITEKEESDPIEEMFRVPQKPEDLFDQGSSEDDEDEDDEYEIFVVKELHKDRIVLDGNHHLAGMDLDFEVEIVNIEPASFEEIEQGFIEFPDEPFPPQTPPPYDGPSLN